MSRKYPDLINDLAIIQGETYVELTDGLIYVEGDWTNGEPRGQIRTDIFANGGALLAEFEFEDSVYDEENNRTIIKPFLQDTVTASLPVTSWKDGKVLSSRNAFVYDIEIQLNLAVIKLAFGWVQVIGEVTAETQTPPVIIPRPTYLTADNNLSELENPEEAIANLGLDDVVRAGDIADFETSTQLDARDIENRKWVNFSGIPAWISNATEFGQSLVNAASAAAAKILLGLDNVDNTSDADKPISDATLTALQVLDGEISANTAARHDAVTTVDSDTIDFQLTDQEITGSVKDGSIDADKLSSGVNASLNKADNAVQLSGNQNIDGVKSFIGPGIILPNNSRINGVEHFYQSTKPTVRGDGSALVVGDRWWKINEGNEWFWNGTYWLSSQEFVYSWAQIGAWSTSDTYRTNVPNVPFWNDSYLGKLLTHYEMSVYFPFSTNLHPTGEGGAVNSTENYWVFRLYERHSTGFGNVLATQNIILGSTQGITRSGTAYLSYYGSLNAVYNLSENLPYVRFTFLRTRVGSPPNLGDSFNGTSFSVIYRNIHP